MDAEEGLSGVAALWLFGLAKARGKKIPRAPLQPEEVLVRARERRGRGFLGQVRPHSRGEDRRVCG